ncbi:MAG: ribosomal protein L1 [Candidatus Parvarchaeum acidophilus ARMAN-5]|jgi:large subunit ribosomal protein L1|uniref:Ribosomal protein L1 n=1 Tax=Candidatus Parvarchaeum acidophilus ARMAN-5 TaxID=662762 RepID=D6GVC9_PARA5|nr:MAG: ribosomal protein L1 [Candidatus Parvarchaeum acidophilus ARMAN-5]
MDKENVENALKEVIKDLGENKKKFKQSIDFIVVLRPRKNKSEVPIDGVLSLPSAVNEIKTCAFVDKDISVKANEVFSKTILKDDFQSFDKKMIRKMIKEYDFFFAEASIMAQMAAKFGKQLTVANKMPNPKTNTIVSPSSDLKTQVKKVESMVRINTKKINAVSVKVGDEGLPSEKITENVMAVYSFIKANLLNGDAGIKHMYLKATMGKKVEI